ncbi:MAG: hypothetical protein L6R39_006117, partial [Caloplaca ligustica]
VNTPCGWELDIQLRPILIDPGDQQRHPKRPTHYTLLPLRPLAKPYRQIANTLRAALDSQRLVVMEGMALAFNAGVLDHGARVSLQPGHGAPDVAVHFYDFLDRGGFEEGRGHPFLDAENYTGTGSDLECGLGGETREIGEG